MCGIPWQARKPAALTVRAAALHVEHDARATYFRHGVSKKVFIQIELPRLAALAKMDPPQHSELSWR